MRDERDVFEFPPFRLEVDDRRLLRGDEEIPLTPKAFDTLVALVRQHGGIVRKQELLDTVWHGAHVEEAVLSQNVYTLRRALGDGGPTHRYIATVPRIGYRFIAPLREATEPAAAGETLPRSVAVLPFDVLGADRSLAWLGVGMADALITRLSRLRELTVRPTSAVLGFAGTSGSAEIGRQLGVEGLLEGRVQVQGERLRATIQLVNLARRSPSWGGQFESDATDLFAAQDALVNHVVGELKLTLSGEESLLLGQGTESNEAYRAYIKGRYFWNQRTPGALAKAIECFREAIEVDPEWALPRAGIADCYALQPLFGDAAAHPALEAAGREAEAALQREPHLAEAHASLAYVRFIHDWAWEAAERSFRRALELRPTYATAHQWYGFLLAALGRFETATIHAARAVELSPLTQVVSADLGWVLYAARQYAAAADQFAATLELDERFAYARAGESLTLLQLGRPDDAVRSAERAVADSEGSSFARAVRIHCLGRAKRAAEADRELDALVEAARREYVPPSRLAVALCGLSRTDAALDALEAAAEHRSRFVVFLRTWPLYDSLRSAPRFRRLLRRVGL